MRVTGMSLRQIAKKFGDEIRGLQLDAGYTAGLSLASASAGSIGAVMGHCIEGNRRAWSSPVNNVDDGFE
jgi:hypothetical protein